jgi:BASS family bile acid:Na+ symporter
MPAITGSLHRMDIATLDQLRIILDPVGQAGLAAALMLMMFSIALGLRTSDFRLLREKPALFIGGVLTQVVGLPFLTFLLIHLLQPPASVALGMLVVACCPGGASSNLLTYLSGGHVAYSVTLTATSSTLAAVLTPASILFWTQAYQPTADLLRSVEVGPGAFLAQTMMLLAVPLILGMLVATKAPEVAAWVRRKTTTAGVLVLGGVIVYGIAYFYEDLVPALPLIGGIVVMHNAAAFLLGQTVAASLSAERTVRRALTFEVGIQNSGLAIVILLGQLKGQGGAAAVAAIWGIWHLMAGASLAALYRYSDRKTAVAEFS